LHESILTTSLAQTSIAPEAQKSLAPRFSVGKWVSMSLSAPEGGAIRRFVARGAGLSLNRLPNFDGLPADEVL
jgi:hypothetical protein